MSKRDPSPHIITRWPPAGVKKIIAPMLSRLTPPPTRPTLPTGRTVTEPLPLAPGRAVLGGHFRPGISRCPQKPHLWRSRGSGAGGIVSFTDISHATGIV